MNQSISLIPHSALRSSAFPFSPFSLKLSLEISKNIG
jgi:hypothetical protein